MKSLALFATILITCTASSQQWYSSPVNNGRDINCIKLFNRDTVVVAGGWKFEGGDSTRSVFRSDNGGLWLWNVSVDTNAHWITSMDFTDYANGIAVCAGGRILSTADNGSHWTPVSSPINRDFNKIFFIDAQNMIIVGGRKGDTTQSHLQTILHSTNGGQSWSVVLDQAGFWLKSVYFPTASIGYAVGDSSTILKTTDGGANWSPITAPIQRNFNGIWFTDAGNGFIVGGYPSNDSIQTILQTTDGGNTWTINKDQVGGMLRDVHFHSPTIGHAVGDYAAVFKSIDGGQTWNTVSIPGASGTQQFNAVRFYSDDFGYVSGQWGENFIYNDEPAPETFTAGATLFDSLSVTLSAFVNSHNEIAAYGFGYSYDFDSVYFETDYPGYIRSNAPVQVQETFSPLEPNRLYHYFSKAWTKGGVVYGDTLTFHTGNSVARITTLDATGIAQNSATLNGSIRGFPDTINLFFEYGVTPGLGSQVAATPASVNDTALHSVSAGISSLQDNTVYFFRLKGVSNTTTYFGNTLTFFNGQQLLAGDLEALPATNILDTSVTLNGTVSGLNVPADISFDYSANGMLFNFTTPPVMSINDDLTYSVSTNISGLTPVTLYYFRMKAQTPLGAFYSDTLQFYTGLTGNYAIITKPATLVTAHSAQLNGSISRFNAPVELSFEYGTTPAMGNTIPAIPASVNDTLTHPVTAPLTGMQDNSLYYYRLKAEVSSGAAVYGETKHIYTGGNPIPNWDFQQWHQNDFSLPYRWNVLGDDYERVAGRSGNYAMKVTGSTLAMLGVFSDGPDVSFFLGVPFKARPDSVSFYADYYIENGDSGLFMVYLYDTAYNNISTTFFPIRGNSNGQFQRISVPVIYNSGLMPDSIVVAFTSTVPGVENENNYLIVDDIAPVPATTGIPNTDFEDWRDYSVLALSGWFYPGKAALDTVPVSIVEQAIFNAPDDYAAEVQNIYFGNGHWGGGELSNRPPTLSKETTEGGFPVQERHQSLNGYFKWFPDGDTMLIDVQLLYHGEQIGFGQFSRIAAVPDFTMFDIPITYSVSGVTPDTAELLFRCNTRNPARGDSHLFIDKLSFDGFTGLEENSTAPVQHPAFITVYPNPASEQVLIHLTGDVKNGKLLVYDLHGNAVYSKDFSGANATVDTRAFSRGLYIVSIEERGKRLTTRLVVVR